MSEKTTDIMNTDEVAGIVFEDCLVVRYVPDDGLIIVSSDSLDPIINISADNALALSHFFAWVAEQQEDDDG